MQGFPRFKGAPRSSFYILDPQAHQLLKWLSALNCPSVPSKPSLFVYQSGRIFQEISEFTNKFPQYTFEQVLDRGFGLLPESEIAHKLAVVARACAKG